MGMLSIPIFSSFAYDDEITHPALTQEIIKLFESYYPEFGFSEKEISRIEYGSQAEDSPNIRCLAHFYDPVYETGLFGNLSAKQWALSSVAQGLLDVKYDIFLANVSQNLFESETDFSFNRAVFEYVHGYKLRGLESLGHTLHLLEDMAVPDHTRNDDHAFGSPYEEYAKMWNKDNIDIADNLIENRQNPVVYSNLNDYFYNLALFSNQNFFSKDTIFDKKYVEPVIDYGKEEILSDGRHYIFGHKRVNSNKLIRIKRERDINSGEVYERYYLDDIDNLIFTDYWNTLSKQAVLYGAGVIKLFFDAVEEEKQTLALYKKNRSGFDVVVAGATDIARRIAKLTSSLAANVNRSLGGIDRQDLLANISSQEEDGVNGEDLGVEIVSESLQFPLLNPPSTSGLKPEDPNSLELQRLALILKEAQKLVNRLEENIGNIRDQNVGGAGDEDLITGENGNNGSEETGNKNHPVIQLPSDLVGSNNNYGGGGSGGGGVTTISSPSVSASTASVTVATTTPTETATTTTSTVTINPPIIISPFNFSRFATTTITFSGTASSTQIISTDFSSATTTVDQNNDWELNLSNFSQGTTTLAFFANDGQNTSSSTEIEIFVNSTATTTPLVTIDAPSLEINQCDNSISSSSCLITTTTLDIQWATSSPCTDFSHFNIESDGVFSTTVATSTRITNLNDNSNYTFSVAVVDINGNASATTTQMAIVSILPVVINEIAWAGTDASSADEWIELYNRSNRDIDLTDWVLYAEDFSPVISFSEASDKIIEARSYYLIERTDDTTISDISADFTAPFSGWTSSSGLSNNGENLILAYKKTNQATTTVDEILFGSGWPTGDNYRTLEKYDPDLPGSETGNWALSIGKYILNGHDSSGVTTIKGTPKARNSINYKIAKEDSLAKDKIITKTNSPYFVGIDGLTIQSGVVLTIEEGVIIKSVRYNNADIIVNGSIHANGSDSEPIIFTAFSDDINGDTNGDGVCVSPYCPGEDNYWSQIIFLPNSQNSEFNHTIFRYGGQRLSSTYPTAMVIMDEATANFNDSIFENSYTSGAYFESATSTISNCTFQNNKTQIAYTDYHPTYYNQYYGLVALGGGITVRNSNFNHNQVGLGLSDTFGAVVDSNIFDNNNSNEESFPLELSGSSGFILTSNSGTGNDKNGISVWGNVTKEGINTVLVENSLPYILEKGLSVAGNSTLEIGPKTVFKFDGGGIGVSGYLNIDGGNNEVDKILFSSMSNSIASQSGISFSSSTSSIKNAEFSYLDKALAFINCNPVDLNLENVRFNNNTWSIYADNQNAQVTFANKLLFATTTSQSMNAAVQTALQNAKDNGADIAW